MLFVYTHTYISRIMYIEKTIYSTSLMPRADRCASFVYNLITYDNAQRIDNIIHT